MAKRGRRAPRPRPAIPAAVAKAHERYLKIVLALPATEVSTSYGTPSIKVRGKILSRWRTEAEGALALRCDFLDRQILLQAQPSVFFLTDHYLNYPMVLVRLDKVGKDVLTDVTLRAWRMVAPAKLVKAHDETLPPAR
jgi:hypothetical protein